ncbi:MAG TPA: proprotein convertase P-domain-containing protein [Myxococcota bacterium]|nr:proprotein convertase P-domain-containing protein [Myxococcota bacterium]HRY94699.1 proprotein convertase P-domain-containing protein [Myxococcota bacterium]HSA20263.1 proprotein convertase P-domain-containing protein [Myxococcota bacterium]
MTGLRSTIVCLALGLGGAAILQAGCGREGYNPVESDACRGVTCSDHGSCADLAGTPVCLCDEGYYAEGLTCLEYVVENPCAGVTCSGYGICAVRNGAAMCVCAQGYHTPPDDRANCVPDIAVCEGEDGSPCDDGEFCTVNDTCTAGLCVGQEQACDDGNSCTVDLCNEIDDLCINTPKADDTPCDDGAYCTLGERCLATQCVGGQPRNCSDGNACTGDVCDEDADACGSSALPDGTACEDGAYCTEGDTCLAGSCAGGAMRGCDDLNPCSSDVCNEAIDSCENPPVVDGTPCEDGQFCTTGDVCSGGGCQGGGARDCSDGDQCSADACDDDADQCAHVPVPDGTVCTDGRFCTLGESCTGGVCGGGLARDCQDGNPCTADQCNDATSTCDHPREQDGLPCDDGQYCTLATQCQAGVCSGGSFVDCSDALDCTLDSCDEQANACANDAAALDGAGCDDGEFCTVADTCNAGTCGGSLNPCDDSNPCTLDACDALAGACTHTPAADGEACDDGLFCTVGDACGAGACTGAARDCGDASVCTADSCNEVSDACVNTAVANGTACDDGQFCNVGEACVGGVCGGGLARNCSDGNQCTADSCDEGADACANADLPDLNPCDDGMYCTLGETCTAGACGGGAARNCSDGNACTQDVCNEMSDSCDHPAVTEGTPCDDGEYCTLADACAGGTCTGGAARDCSDGNACTNDVCDEVGNGCVSTAVANGTSCSDGQFCTLGETCTSGVCGGGVARSCADGNACTADSCNDVSDACVNTPVANGTACDDGAYCTQGETCQAGACGNSSSRNCSDGNGCTLDFCDESGDVCAHEGAAMDGTPCNDGLFCTSDDACLSGACTGGGARNCSDGVACTVDSCDEVGNACLHDAAAANGAACNDGLFCTLNDACSNGACAGGGARGCSDGNACTVDSCDDTNDVCVNNAAAANGQVCDDGLFCNTGETCSGGVCAGGAARVCADANQCTADSCSEATDACVYSAPAANGLACNDTLFCNTGETCLNGACQGGAANTCSDGNVCTVDSCNEAGDTCVNNAAAANGTACSDGLYCTTGEVCTAGACGGGLARNCADADPCTNDTCNEGTDTCAHAAVANGTACDDGAWCNIGETCTGGVCGGGVARTCSDGNQCTSDSCNDATDACVNTSVANGTPCEDGQYCITGETCTAGVCGGGGPRTCTDGNQCTVDSCNEAGDTCAYDAAAMNGVACNDGAFCLVGETCSSGVCGGGAPRTCDDSNPCTANNCSEALDLCQNPALANGTACEDGLFCTSPDTCQAGACQAGLGDPCTADPCSSLCTEATDTCGGCTPAGTYCASLVQEATCDGSCNMTALTICGYGCNLGRDECNQCTPSSVECRADLEYLCNAEFVCDASGLVDSKTCCSSNRCDCDGSMCLEDVCASATDLTGGGTLAGTTCDDDDNIPGDCFPGGPACKAPALGGAPEQIFQFTVPSFSRVTLDSSGSALDTTLRTSTMCGNETFQVPNADVCGLPGTTPEQACQEGAGPETMVLCGLPPGTYYGAVDSALGSCGLYDLDVTITPVDLDTAPNAGNISMGGTFTGTTCGLADNFQYPNRILWSGATCANCVADGVDADCPDCGVNAATDCTLPPNGTDDKCTYHGGGSPDAVFYLALDTASGVDISTAGSGFDTVLYVMQTGVSGASPPGLIRKCNDDCWTTDGPSHIQTSLEAGLYYVYLDGANGACGNYVLDVQVSPAAACPNLSCEPLHENCRTCPFDCPCPHCGDGAIDAGEGEDCDDGNAVDADGCTRCAVDRGYYCIGQPSDCSLPTYLSGTDVCNCAIPDCSRPGSGECNTSQYGTLTRTIAIGSACTVMDVHVDMNIAHTWIGDLTLELTSPGGASVIFLHNRSGAGGDAILGNYDLSLPVDGPGSLADFTGDNGQGSWTLTIHDWYELDSGTLNTWALYLTCI